VRFKFGHVTPQNLGSTKPSYSTVWMAGVWGLPSKLMPWKTNAPDQSPRSTPTSDVTVVDQKSTHSPLAQILRNHHKLTPFRGVDFWNCIPSGLVYHPGVEWRANFKSISHRCHLFEVAFAWELTEETIHLPLGAIRKQKCFICSPFYGTACRWAVLGELKT